MNDILQKQIQFQREVGFPVDSIKESDRNRLSEIYIFKAIEELVELRKEFPSSMNPWSKSQSSADKDRILEELSDVILFIVNFCNIWKLDVSEVLGQIQRTQHANFESLKRKKMDRLNQEILSIPSYTSGVGHGSISPKYIFVGQNPGRDITHGYVFWSDKSDGSSKILLPIIEKLGITEDSYFTNVVKSTTPDNIEPSGEMTQFWMDFFTREIEILKINNPGVKIIPMGKWTQRVLSIEGIQHPASVLYGNLNKDDYEEEIRKFL